MKIVLCDGGLFNQVIQYVFARNVEIHTGEQVLLDNTWFYTPHDQHLKELEEIEVHQFQLHKFANAKYKLVSDHFAGSTWDEIQSILARQEPIRGGSYLPKILRSSGLDLMMIRETVAPHHFEGNTAMYPPHVYTPEMLDAKGNVYYYGYFNNGNWFMRHQEQLMQELQLPPLAKESDQLMAKQIEDSFAISVHVRRSGYVKIGATIPDEFYKTHISELYKRFRHKKNLQFFIFSDEIDWVQANEKNLGIDKIKSMVTYGEKGRTVVDNHVDFQLMAMCDAMILSQSVYSYYSALMNPKKDKVVINPHPQKGEFW